MPDVQLGDAIEMMFGRANQIAAELPNGKTSAQVIERGTDRILEMIEIGF